MERGVEIAVGKWIAPECPFRIVYSTRVLDDIRLAVVDAFFSLPRGGAEIGGVLLGQHESDMISITGFEPLDCEHAMGPSFILSPRDQSQLAELTARASRNPRHLQPLGWYHSHTRSDIFLSETDQDIHKRFFPELWQVALVLKPHTFEPTRGGFFFREADGSIRGSASYQEFKLDPLPMRPVPTGGPPPTPHRPLHQESPFAGATLTLPSTVPSLVENPPPAADPPPAEKKRVPITREIPADILSGAPPDTERQEVVGDVPRFAALSSEERSGRAVKVVACLAVGLALGGLGYQTRGAWFPGLAAKIRPALPKEPDTYMALAVIDTNGQLEIHWDRNAEAVRNALEATLEITDGSQAPQSVRLDGPHLATGAFSYGRQNERVDVMLIASEPSGQQVKEQTSYLGKLPGRGGQTEDPEIRKDRDEQAQKAEQLQKDLNFQASKTRKLEKDLKDVREQLQNEQRRRLGTQAADTGKKDN